MIASTLIRTAREGAGLSKRELARRAGTSAAAIVMYEQGTRDPSVETLARIVTAAGARADVRLIRGPGRDRCTAAHRLEAVLDLAEHLPRKAAARRLAFPKFG